MIEHVEHEVHGANVAGGDERMARGSDDPSWLSNSIAMRSQVMSRGRGQTQLFHPESNNGL